MQALPVFTFANQAGLDMLETTLVALQDITLEKIFDDNGRKTLFSEFPQIMQQVCGFEVQLRFGQNIEGLDMLCWWLSLFYCWNRWLINLTFLFLFTCVGGCRVLCVFKVAYACQAWEGQSPMRGQWHGRCWMKKKLLTASASCSSTGHLSETLDRTEHRI